jgi:hypothetical protein
VSHAAPARTGELLDPIECSFGGRRVVAARVDDRTVPSSQCPPTTSRITTRPGRVAQSPRALIVSVVQVGHVCVRVDSLSVFVDVAVAAPHAVGVVVVVVAVVVIVLVGMDHGVVLVLVVMGRAQG